MCYNRKNHPFMLNNFGETQSLKVWEETFQQTVPQGFLAHFCRKRWEVISTVVLPGKTDVSEDRNVFTPYG
jgi:hypothetical protein